MSPALPPHSSQRSIAFVVTLLLLLGSWLAALGFVVWRLREDTLANSLATATTHARNFEEHLTQTLQVIDLTAGSIDPFHNGKLDFNDLGARLVTALRPAPFLRSISLLDANGKVLASSNPDNLGTKIELAGFFPNAAPEAEVLRIGWPWRGRDLATGSPASESSPLAPTDASFVPVLRQLSVGSEQLWLVAALNPDYFINHFSQLVEPADGRVQWLRYDGILLFSSGANDVPGGKTAAGQVPEKLAQREHGQLQQTLGDAYQAMTAYRASTRFPIVVAVHLDRQVILAQWNADTRRLAAIVLPMLLAFTVAGFLAWRRQQRLSTQQAELERQRRLAASVFSASSDSVVLTSPDGSILSANPAFERISGYAAAEALGRNPRFLASGVQDREFYRRLWSKLIADGHWQGELVNRRKDGSHYTVLLTINSVTDDQGNLQHYVGISSDITERKRYEAEILEAKARSEAAALAKTAFLATMSHEIRTPMNGVLGMTDLLLMSDPTDEQRDRLMVVKSSADSLLTILNEILDFSKIESQGVTIESIAFDPAEIVNDIVGLFSGRAESKSVQLALRIDPSLPTRVMGDPTRVRQILSNLISNAIKFTHAGTITIAAEPGEARDNAEDRRVLRFTVTDSGIGIPPDKLDLIFDAFSQADASTTRHYGGTGLGLAISRRLAEALGGDLSVVSTLGKGSTFTLQIEVGAPRLETVHSAPVAKPLASQPRHILLVEDNLTNQVVMRGLLKKLGHSVRVTGDGKEALAAIAEEAFDVVLMDVQMPVMDGLAATREVRAMEAASGKHLPIIALTANAFESDREACYAAGMDDFISKPVGFEALQETLARCCHRP
jgi:PAS domain S-box-containing protein